MDILSIEKESEDENEKTDLIKRDFSHYIGQDKRSNGNGCAVLHDFMLLIVRYVDFADRTNVYFKEAWCKGHRETRDPFQRENFLDLLLNRLSEKKSSKVLGSPSLIHFTELPKNGRSRRAYQLRFGDTRSESTGYYNLCPVSYSLRSLSQHSLNGEFNRNLTKWDASSIPVAGTMSRLVYPPVSVHRLTLQVARFLPHGYDTLLFQQNTSKMTQPVLREVKHTNEWEDDLFFVMVKEKCVCLSLIFNSSGALPKKANIERHFKTMHLKYTTDFPIGSELRKVKVHELKSNLHL
ncbi:hypothetical protein TNCV_837011 [Trichonephila clavipes]|nr:hypothetical protein TNCV_837011 [Trichonephila clavipes]